MPDLIGDLGSVGDTNHAISVHRSGLVAGQNHHSESKHKHSRMTVTAWEWDGASLKRQRCLVDWEKSSQQTTIQHWLSLLAWALALISSVTKRVRGSSIRKWRDDWYLRKGFGLRHRIRGLMNEHYQGRRGKDGGRRVKIKHGFMGK
ncbi:hypothetical protein RRG08_013163 [Elysia crispata]|uniref:Uncharacterized protein n=1 Tax=Elysia crispata TaxID=231223 RepID=A0AAE1A0P8_9GAST|nr:hypothetical protein RRG08_013163 [Elysia crispata]